VVIGTLPGTLAVELVPSPIATGADIERAIVSFARGPNGGLVLPPDKRPPTAIGYNRHL
jgi:hypothetical protein